MYLDHYDLKLMPFEIGPDPKFLWLGSKHEEAFSVLHYGIVESKGIIVIIGDPGTGKSTLLNATVANFGSNIRYAKISDPALNELNFFYLIANSLMMDKTFQSKAEFLIKFEEYVKDAGAHSRKIVFVIDEAQRLTPTMLEQIRVFLNFEPPGQKVISCIFAGQAEFIDMIKRNRALEQRVFFSHIIQPFSQSEANEYIAHRLKIAGSEDPIFSANALKEIFRLSAGIPRLINVICDQALLSGYALDKKKIGPELIREAAQNTLIRQNPPPQAPSEAKALESSRQSDPTGVIAENTGRTTESKGGDSSPPAPSRTKALWAAIVLSVIVASAGYVYLTSGSRTPSTASQRETGLADSGRRRTESLPAGDKSARRQTRLAENADQKDPAANRPGEDEKQSTGFPADIEELKKDHAAALEAAVSERDKKLVQLEQKYGELEKTLAREKASKDQVGVELSVRHAAITDLQKRLKESESAQLKIEAELQATHRENVRLQSLLKAVKVQKPPPPTPEPAIASPPSQSPLVAPDADGAVPDPAGAIDFVLNRKSPRP